MLNLCFCLSLHILWFTLIEWLAFPTIEKNHQFQSLLIKWWPGDANNNTHFFSFLLAMVHFLPLDLYLISILKLYFQSMIALSATLQQGEEKTGIFSDNKVTFPWLQWVHFPVCDCWLDKLSFLPCSNVLNSPFSFPSSLFSLSVHLQLIKRSRRLS